MPDESYLWEPLTGGPYTTWASGTSTINTNTYYGHSYEDNVELLAKVRAHELQLMAMNEEIMQLKREMEALIDGNEAMKILLDK